MAASRNTLEEVVRVLVKHLDQDTLRRIVKDLLEVRGNASFEQTIRSLWNRIKD